MAKKLPTVEPTPAPSPLLPAPTSPLMQSEEESYRQTYKKRLASYPYDRDDDIVSRVMGNTDPED